jgi:hypothetical protein
MSSLLDGVDMLCFPIDVSRGYQDGTEDPTVIYERLAVRDATFCKPQRSTEYAAMDGSDMIRNLLLGNFDSRTAKTNFYVTVWLPIERFVQRSVPDHYDDDNNESSKTATNSSVTTMKSLLTEFLSNEAKQMTEEDLQRLKQRMRTFKTASSNVGVGGSLYKNFECWMTTHDADQFQKSDDSIDNDSTSSSTSFSERHTLDVGRRLLEYATTKLSS